MRRAFLFLGLVCLAVLLLLSALRLRRPVWTEWMLRGAERLASRSLGVEVRAESLCVGLEKGIVLKGLRIGPSPSGPGHGEGALSVEEIRVLPDWAELLRGRVSLDSVRVVAPRLRIGKDSQGKLLLPAPSFSGRGEKTGSGKLLTLKIRQLSLEEGGVSLEGLSEPVVERLQVRLRDFSTGSAERASLDLSAEILPQGKIELRGWIAAGAGPIQSEVRFAGTGVSLAPWKEFLARHGFAVEKTLAGWDIACEGNSEEGLRGKGRLVLGPVESSHIRGPVEEVSVRCDVFYSLEESAVRMHALEVEARDVLRAAFQGVLPSPGRQGIVDGTVRVERIDLSRLQLPSGVQLAGLLSADSFAVRWDRSGGGLPIAEGTARIQEWRTSFGGFTLEGPRLEIAFSREPGIRLKTSEAASLAGEPAGPLLGAVPVGLSAEAVLADRAIRFDGSLSVGTSRARLGREGVVSWKKADLRASGNLGKERSEARLEGAVRDLRYGDVDLPEVSLALVLERTDGRIVLKQPRIQAKGLSLSAGSVEVCEVAGSGKRAVKAEGLDGAYRVAGLEIRGGKGEVLWIPDPHGPNVQWDFSCKAARAWGIALRRVASSGRVRPAGLQGSLSVQGPESGTVTVRVKGHGQDRAFPAGLEILIEDWDLKSLSGPLADRLVRGLGLSGRLQELRFEGTARSPGDITGKLGLQALSLSAVRNETGRFLFKDVSLRGGADFQGPDLSWTVALDCGPVHAVLEGRAGSFGRPERRLTGHVAVAPVELAALREAFWDVTPDGMLYMGLEGTASADVDWVSDRGVFGCLGEVVLDQVRLEGEYGEFSLGPVNGTIPVSYSGGAVENWAEPFPDFRRSAHESLLKALESDESALAGSHKITIGEVAAGFPLVRNLELAVRSEKGITRVDRIAGDVFGGKIRGLAAVLAGPAPRFQLGLIARGIRLSALCNAIEPIRGYLSGCVDGTVRIEGSGSGGLAGLSGRAEFWTYGKDCEKTRISRQLLEKIAGRSMPMLFRDRPFDKGELTILLSRGFMVFQDLEISNKNLIGMTDLSVRVAPQNNRIAVDHLLTSLATAAARARNAQKGP